MRTAALLFCAAAIPRIAYLLIYRPPVESQYWALAGSLLGTGTFVIDGVAITDFEPLYPAFLAIARQLAGDSGVVVQLIQIGVASAGAVLLYRLALVFSGSRRVGVIAAALFAAYPLLIRHASTISDSTLTTVLLIGFATAFAAVRGSTSAAVAGLWLGLSVLSRAMVLPLVGAAAILLLVRRGRRDALVLALVATVVMAPWWIRNFAVNGSLWPTRSGINMFIGNSPYSGALIPRYDLDLLETPAYELAAAARPDIVAGRPDFIPRIDAYLTALSFEHMKQHPLGTLTQKLKNAWYFLSPQLVPLHVSGPETRIRLEPPDIAIVEESVARPRVEVVSHTVAAFLVMAAAIAGIYYRRHALARDGVLWAIAGVFVLVYAVYFPATRYRAPMEFVFFFYAAIALDRLFDRRAPHHTPRLAEPAVSGTSGA